MTDEFLQKYKELEQMIIEHYPVEEGSSAVWALGDVKEFVPFRPQLNAIREIRNFLTHQPQYEKQPLITPTESAIQILNNLISKINGPRTVYNVCIKPNAILSAKIDDQVAPVIRLMADRNFHVVPILNSGKVTGVFFDSAAVLKEIENGILDNDTTFYQLKRHIDLDAHIGRDVLFLPKVASIESAKELIAECFQKGNRINVVFITETGKVSETLVGLLLPLQLV